jgi:hypothetical protein
MTLLIEEAEISEGEVSACKTELLNAVKALNIACRSFS